MISCTSFCCQVMTTHCISFFHPLLSIFVYFHLVLYFWLIVSISVCPMIGHILSSTTLITLCPVLVFYPEISNILSRAGISFPPTSIAVVTILTQKLIWYRYFFPVIICYWFIVLVELLSLRLCLCHGGILFPELHIQSCVNTMVILFESNYYIFACFYHVLV